MAISKTVSKPTSRAMAGAPRALTAHVSGILIVNGESELVAGCKVKAA